MTSTATQQAPLISDEAIDAAAAWWAKVMERPKFDALGEERDASMEMAQVMMSMIAAKNPTTPEQLAAFRDTLASRLRHEVAGLRRAWLCLSVDYGPCPILGDAAVAAGITNECAFPIKTTMWLDDEGVKVRHGYGAPQKQVWPVEVPS